MKKIILIIVCLSIIPITKLMGKICVKDYVESRGRIGCVAECWQLF